MKNWIETGVSPTRRVGMFIEMPAQAILVQLLNHCLKVFI
jgi:hypothetical protein